MPCKVVHIWKDFIKIWRAKRGSPHPSSWNAISIGRDRSTAPSSKGSKAREEQNEGQDLSSYLFDVAVCLLLVFDYIL